MSSTRWALETFAQRLGALSPLSRDDVAAILALPGEAVVVRGNVDIELPGQAFEQAYLVATGLVARFVQLADGGQQFTAIHVPGDMADVHRIASPLAGSALRTLCSSTIVRVPAKSLRALAMKSPAITQAFWAYSAVDAAVLSQWTANLGRREAKARLANFLCEMGVRSEYSGRGTRAEYLLEMSQAQIGDALGLTAVHVNRTLKELKKSHMVEIDGRIVRIKDWALLCAVADFDSAYLQLEQLPEKAA